MMDYKMFAVCLFAIGASYLMFTIPVAFATDVNIYYNGQKAGSAQISPQNMVSKTIQVRHDESDVSWSNTKVLVRVSTASLANSVKKIYLYKCKKLDPNACMQTTPQTFDNWIDTELAWSDMSEQAGQSNYPQVGNILILVKLEGINDRVSWMAFWNTITRMDYNIFDSVSYEIDRIDAHAKSADLVQPISSYIGNFQMIPFNWVSRVVFNSATVLYGGGGSSSDLSASPPDLQTAQTSNQVTAINKDYYFIFSNISSGVTNAITMNLNPSYTCGDGTCDSDLGETSLNCCYDCGCSSGNYCDVTSTTGYSSTCRSRVNISLTVTGSVVPTPLQQCTSQMAVNISARINNPPSNLPASISGYVKSGSIQYPVACSGSNGIDYVCQLRLMPPVSCGFGTFALGPNTLNMTVSFKDGSATTTKDLSTTFAPVNVNYDCGCPANFYCDIGPNLCRSEGSIMLQVISVDSYLADFTGANDHVAVQLRIVNAPTNMTVNTFTFNFGNITWTGNSMPASHPTVNCVPAGNTSTSRDFNCSPILTISGYSPNESYVVRANTVNASIAYTDGGISKQAVLTAPFGDITIPQQSCGNGRVDPREDQTNCCRDAGCPQTGQYCDLISGCQYVGNISLTVINVNPTNVSDCTIPHYINLTARIGNVPYGAALSYFSYLRNGEVQGWNVWCSNPAQYTGVSVCTLTMPVQSNCTLPFSRIDGNSINMTLSFRNGDREMQMKQLNAPFSDLLVTPAWHCGNNACESSYGESASNCCVDCSCKTSPLYGTNYYCNYDQTSVVNGSCEQKSNISLIIDSPTGMVSLKNCEYDQKTNIKAHIENPPAQMRVQNYYGVLNGKSTDVVCEYGQLLSSSTYAGGWSCIGTTYSGAWSCLGTNCSQYTSQAGCMNVAGCAWGQSSIANSCSQYTNQIACQGNSGCTWQPDSNLISSQNLNCTINIPSQSECKKGSVYHYMNNSLGVYISYRDGKGSTIVQALSGTLPVYKASQTYKSLDEIIDDAVSKLKDNLEEELQLMRDLLEWIKTCIYMQMVIVVIGIAAMAAGGYYGYNNGGGAKGLGQGVTAGATAANFMTTAWGNICNMIKEYYNAERNMISIDNEIIKMELCIDVNQHQMDSGGCSASGTSGMMSCYSSLSGCIDMGTINSYFSSASSSMNNIATYGNNIGQAGIAAGAAFEKLDTLFSGGGGAAARARFVDGNNNPIAPVLSTSSGSVYNYTACDRYANIGGTFSLPPGQNPRDSAILEVVPGSGCAYPAMLGNSGFVTSFPSSPIPLDGMGDPSAAKLAYDYKLYCFSSQSDFANNQGKVGQVGTSSYPVQKEIRISVLSDTGNTGVCTGMGGGAAVSTALHNAVNDIGSNANTFMGILGQYRTALGDKYNTIFNALQTIINNNVNRALQSGVSVQVIIQHLNGAQTNANLIPDTGISDVDSRTSTLKGLITTALNVAGQQTTPSTTTPSGGSTTEPACSTYFGYNCPQSRCMVNEAGACVPNA